MLSQSCVGIETSVPQGLFLKGLCQSVYGNLHVGNFAVPIKLRVYNSLRSARVKEPKLLCKRSNVLMWQPVLLAYFENQGDFQGLL